MRIVFCGSGSFATPTLNAICATDHDVVGAITQPPRRAGRGGKMRPTDVAVTAGERDIAVLETPDVNSPESVETIAEMQPDVICVAEFGQMIRKQVRELARLDTFNLHASLLPELRGAAPVNWAIIRGHRHTGVTTFSLVDRMDAGRMYLKEETEILPDETAASLRSRLADIGAGVVCRTLGLLAGGWAEPVEQDENHVTFAPLLKKADGIIYWTDTAETIRDLIHGACPWPGAQAVFAPQHGRLTPVTITAASLADGVCDYAPGVLNEDLNVCTGLGTLSIHKIKPAGKRLMAWRDFVNGYRVDEGDGFLTEGPHIDG